MLLLASLVHDTPAGVRRFLELNLRNGADGVLLVLDAGAPDPELDPGLAAHVLVVRSEDWWPPGAAPPLNGRQRVAANLARVAAAAAGAEWLFFVDGDEVALLDRDVLAAVPDDVPVVRLPPLEAVSDPRTADPHLFKRLLETDELERLHRAGLVERPRNMHWFRGHTTGKVGVRPAAPVRLTVHGALGTDDQRAPEHRHPALRLLHLESGSPEEFVRKWQALASSGPPPGMRGRRQEVLEAFTRLASADLSDDELRRHHLALYDAHAREDGAALLAAGVLERVDLEATRAEPRATDEDLERLSAAVERLTPLDKRLFYPSTPVATLDAAVRAALS